MPTLSIWEKETFFALQDVIIAGCGFSGLWSALHLKLLHPGYNITLLEKELIPKGASTRNAGFSCFGSPSELISNAATMGEDNMWRLVEMRYKGLLEIRKFFSDEEIDYDASGGYECFMETREGWRLCADQLDSLNKNLKIITGEEDLFKKSDSKLADFGFSGFDHLIENKLEGGLNPAKLIKALLKKVQALGVQIVFGVSLAGYEEKNDQVVLTTSLDHAFTCRQLLICTNAYTKNLIPGIDIIPNRGQVLITGPITNLPFRGTFHFDQGFYYFRNLGDRLLLGGARNMAFEEENTDEMETTSLIQNGLEDFITQHLLPGKSFTITDRWSGIMAMGTEKHPIIQQFSSGVFCCVRMSGMGVALAPVAAQQVVRLMEK